MAHKDRPFRVGDQVVVTYRSGRKEEGRVIATGRENLYGHSVVVLVENRDVDSFTEKGTRYGSNEIMLTLGRLKKDGIFCG